MKYIHNKITANAIKKLSKIFYFGLNDYFLSNNQFNISNLIQILKEVCGHHQNIVGFHGVVRDKCTIAMILEYIPGSPFLEGILNWPRFNENDLKKIAMQLLDALKYCHEKRIIHRVSGT